MIRKHNQSLENKPVGFNNIGSMCYFNALLQSLLSSSIFIDDLKLKNISIINENSSYELLNKTLPALINEQQCSFEAYQLLVDVLKLDYLFTVKYQNQIFCRHCKNKKDHVITDIAIILENKEYADFVYKIKNPYDFIDNYKCDCGKTDRALSYCHLKLISEMLIFVSNIFDYQQNRKLPNKVNYPLEMIFNGKFETLVYKPVAFIQHIGNINGGHYWAHCFRNNKWWLIDDLNIIELTTAPSDHNTYMAIYTPH